MYKELVERLRKCFDKGVYLPSDILQAADAIETLESELNHLRHERDQAVEDLNTLRKRSGWKCEACYYNDHYNRDICTGCEYNNDNNWQWRGVQEENNG
ncbi:MAG: hypothetical protein ACLRQY_07580 [[Clostridium] leptum]